MRPLLNYYGGKWNSAQWIISYFPDHEIYCEPFAGGASVLLQKERSKREILNDLDGEIVNLLKVMRDRYGSLEKKLILTPHSRVEFIKAYRDTKEPIERARRTLIKSYFGIGDSHAQRNGMRSSKTSNTCVAKSWMNWVDNAWELADRLRGVTIENLPYANVIEKYASPQTLFYMDPPYVKDTRNDRHGYRHDFDDEDHRTLIDVLERRDLMVVLSGYDHPIYDRLGWHKVTQDFRTQKGSRKTETLWLSPKAMAASRQMALPL